MDRNHSTTPERERGQHLGFEERCSIKACRKLGLSLRKTADHAFRPAGGFVAQAKETEFSQEQADPRQK
ncbi:MAG: hypothetical protein ACOYJI_05325, partial [Anaerovoracaceae bacterium]